VIGIRHITPVILNKFSVRSSVAVFSLSVIITLSAKSDVIVDTLPANDQANLSADAGQTFTTGFLGAENALATIEIEGPQASNPGDALGPFTLELWTDADGNHATWGTGTFVASSDSQSMVTGGATLTTFGFESLPVLTDSSVYAFVFTDGNGTRVPARFGLTNASAISDGTIFSGGAQAFNDAFDTAMRITTVSSVSEIPEPTSIFVLSGILGVSFGMRRRK
jgi:hypothetical protein